MTVLPSPFRGFDVQRVVDPVVLVLDHLPDPEAKVGERFGWTPSPDADATVFVRRQYVRMEDRSEPLQGGRESRIAGVQIDGELVLRTDRRCGVPRYPDESLASVRHYVTFWRATGAREG